jgi:hypothetical protein
VGGTLVAPQSFDWSRLATLRAPEER